MTDVYSISIEVLAREKEETIVEEPSSSIIQTMNQDILDQLDFMSEWLDVHHDPSDNREEEEESFNTARSSSTTMFNQ